MDDLDIWFAEQILPHEGALTAYLRRVWPDASEIIDLRQEVYVRVYGAASVKRPSVARYFLFTVARNLLVDRLRHRRVVTIDLMEDLSSLDVLSDELPADRILSGRQELARLEAALAHLPPRCRETFIMRKIEDRPQKEVANIMGVAEATVEKQLIKAMRMLTDLFWSPDAGGELTSDKNDAELNHEQRS